MTTNAETVATYFQAVNTEDWELFRSVITDDAEYWTMGARPRKGADEVIEFFKGLFKAWSVHYDDPIWTITEGDKGSSSVEFRGTSVNGVAITFPAVDIFEFRDGRLAKWSTWYDLTSVRKELERTA